MRMEGKERKGISLVALIITIIVLIILTGAVIVSIIGENNTIDKAKEATNLNNLDNLKTAYMMERSNNMLEGIQDDVGALQKAAESCQMESDFEFEGEIVKYKGENIDAKA